LPTPAQRFSGTATGYAATMAPALRPVSEAVVSRAALAPGERVLDIGTGTGTAAALARGDGRQVVAIDAAPGMLDIARARVEGVAFEEMDFSSLRFPDGSFDVVLAVHALHFAGDGVAALVEWRRVTAHGGRLSLAVPGPRERTPNHFYREVYARHGIDPVNRYPSEREVADMARRAGWEAIETETDPSTALELPDEAAFRLWREIGFRGSATDHLTDADQQRLTDEMLAATERTADGAFRIPFGTIYLTAKRLTA
jgi:ubiquinone/menaquinone biosynthesis C-methylase UbiE